jgi:glucokinase
MAGHSTIAWQGAKCPFCGNIGCAEQEASSAVLPRLLAHAPGYAQSALSKEAKQDYAAVFRLAREGDPCAIAVRDHSIKVWGVHAANLVLAFDPAKVIVGGGIANAPEVIDGIRAHIHTHALTPWGKV